MNKNMEMQRVTKRGRRRKGKSHEDSKRKSDWSRLPNDLLDLIMRKLFYIDQIKFHIVCRSWSVVNGVPPLKQMPWLMSFDEVEAGEEGGEYSWSFSKLTDPLYKKTYTVNMNKIKEQNLKNIQVHESKYGWLLISASKSKPTPSFTASTSLSPLPVPGYSVKQEPYTEDSTSLLSLRGSHRVKLEQDIEYCSLAARYNTVLFLYTPFLTQNNLIHFPALKSNPSIATFSTNPSASSKEDFMILVMNSITNRILNISTCRWGETSWVTHAFTFDVPLSNIKSLVYSDGYFYFSNICGTFAFSISKRKWSLSVKPQSEIEFLQRHDFGIFMAKSDAKEKEDEELFLIYSKDKDTSCCRLDVCIFRLDRCSRTWERIYYLENQVLFVGSGCTSYLREAPSKEMASRIYYCSGSIMKHYAFNTGDRCYPCTKHYGSLAKKNCQKIWIEPPCY